MEGFPSQCRLTAFMYPVFGRRYSVSWQARFFFDAWLSTDGPVTDTDQMRSA